MHVIDLLCRPLIMRSMLNATLSLSNETIGAFLGLEFALTKAEDCVLGTVAHWRRSCSSCVL